MAHDLVIEHARIIDGLGTPARDGSLAVKDGRVAAISGDASGRELSAAVQRVDAGGLALAPGIVEPRRSDGRMSVVGIDHVQLAMPAGREDEARAFYARLLGIPEIAKPPELAKRGGAWFESGVVKVHLGVEPDFRPARKAHPALLVRNLRGLVLRLREAGVEVVDDEPLPGYDRVFTTDPFGNRLELLEPLR